MLASHAGIKIFHLLLVPVSKCASHSTFITALYCNSCQYSASDAHHVKTAKDNKPQIALVGHHKMADAVKHTCNNCKIPMEYREISRLSCGHQFCTFCLDQQAYNRIKQPCQICYHLTVPKVQDMPSLVGVQQTDTPQMPSVSTDKGKL